jgi:nucleoside-diphosphate kinase
MEWLQEQTDLEIKNMAWRVAYLHRLEAHYAEHKGKDFYPGLISEMVSKPLVAIMGTTAAGIPTVRDAVMRFRRSWQTVGPRNLLHCSDSPEAAVRETTIWFPSV